MLGLHLNHVSKWSPRCSKITIPEMQLPWFQYIRSTVRILNVENLTGLYPYTIFVLNIKPFHLRRLFLLFKLGCVTYRYMIKNNKQVLITRWAKFYKGSKCGSISESQLLSLHKHKPIKYAIPCSNSVYSISLVIFAMIPYHLVVTCLFRETVITATNMGIITHNNTYILCHHVSSNP